jgi:hypothetical protein
LIAVRKIVIVRAALLFFLVMLGCDLPRDPLRTLERARGGELRVGVSEDPPLLVRRGEEAAGEEADLIRGFASRIGARVRWVWGAEEKHLAMLEHHQLHLVAGGLTRSTPWMKKVAVTRPYREERVLAAPPGENAFLLELERYLAEQRR